MPKRAVATISATQLFKRFPDEAACIKWLEAGRWDGKPACPHCGGTDDLTRPESKPFHYWHKDCRKHFTVKTGTIIHSSKTPTQNWVIAIYLVLTAREGISSLQLSEELGVQHRTAWYMLQRIREACSHGDFTLSNVVEPDETHVGGKRKKLKAGHGAIGKTAVAGASERGSMVSAKPVDRTGAVTLTKFEDRIELGAKVRTDEAHANRSSANEVNCFRQEAAKFRYIDLFAGIGGMSIPFRRRGGECVLVCEQNAKAVQTYLANHALDCEIVEDANALNGQAPEHDLLLAGFPCQPFSIAGVSKRNALGRPNGFECAAEGNLFFRVVEVLERTQPRAFLLENVKHLVRHRRGQTFNIMLDALTQLGYDVQHRIINSQAFVPQKRERVFIVGFRGPHSFRFDSVRFPPPSKWPVLGDILEDDVEAKYTLSDHMWSYLQEYRRKHEAKGNGFGYKLFGPEDVPGTMSARYYKDGAEILVRQNGSNPRRLTPRECARLMGFDGPASSRFKIPVSDLQAYKQFGNAVVVPVVSAIAAQLVQEL